jgi:hypothetical protein
LEQPEARGQPAHNNSSRSVPVWQWNLKFSGDDSVAEFLTQVREYMQSRHVSEQELLESASELFKGNALKWFRQITVSYNIQSWADIAERLLIDFQGHDYNDELLDSIKGRKQRENESITIYVAIMEDMFQRLNVWPTERERIKILRKNVLPYYIHQTSLITFSTVEEFKAKCKLLEAGKIQAEGATMATKSNSRQTTSSTNMFNDRMVNNRNNQPRREAYQDRRPYQQTYVTRMQPPPATRMRQNYTPANNYPPPVPHNYNMTNNRQTGSANQLSNSTNHGPQCWLCRQNGHISRECPNRENVIGAVEGSLHAPQIIFQDPIQEEYHRLQMNNTTPQIMSTTNTLTRPPIMSTTNTQAIPPQFWQQQQQPIRERAQGHQSQPPLTVQAQPMPAQAAATNQTQSSQPLTQLQQTW